MLYLDANATEPLRPAASRAALAAMELDGNPSSVHAAGRAARLVLEDARESLAARLKARKTLFLQAGRPRRMRWRCMGWAPGGRS
jgi:cysteine desulfurase